jgi:hypothetical protein
MLFSPDRRSLRHADSRERAARCLTDYLEQLPLGTEQRLELALDVLRELPADASPDQALAALHSRLPALDATAYPPSRPPLSRGHMPAQYLGRPRTGLRGFAAQWGWVLVVALLLALTLLLNLYQ